MASHEGLQMGLIGKRGIRIRDFCLMRELERAALLMIICLQGDLAYTLKLLDFQWKFV